jgi:hypothetical protein
MWLDKLVSLKAYLQKNPSATRDELMKALDLKLPKLKYLLRVSPVFDTEAIEKVRQAGQPADSPKESAHTDPPVNPQGGRHSPDLQKTSIDGSGHPKLGPQPETSAQGPYIFSYTSVKALSGLKGRGQQGSGLKKENRKPQD